MDLLIDILQNTVQTANNLNRQHFTLRFHLSPYIPCPPHHITCSCLLKTVCTPGLKDAWGAPLITAHSSPINTSFCVGNRLCMVFVHTYCLSIWLKVDVSDLHICVHCLHFFCQWTRFKCCKTGMQKLKLTQWTGWRVAGDRRIMYFTPTLYCDSSVLWRITCAHGLGVPTI